MSKLTRLCKTSVMSAKKYQSAYQITDEFYKGDVILIKQGLMDASYKIKQNGALIKVGNSLHLRLLPNQFSFPLYDEYFTILAPLESIKILQGSMSSGDIIYLSAGEYIDLKRTYYS